MFDFRIQGVDILPNIIGYLFMYSGLRGLASYNSEFDSAKKYAVPLVILSLFSIYQVQYPAGQAVIHPLSLVFQTIGIISMVLDLLLVYHLCLGIMELAQEQLQEDLRQSAYKRWRFYLYLKIILIIWLPLSLMVPFLAVIGFLPMFILSIAVMVLMMALMRKAQDSIQF